MRLLCTGDLHLGRRSSGAVGDGFSCGDAWDRIARLAAGEEVEGRTIERVGAVLISGDVTDEAGRYFQAIGPFERGLRRLTDAGIPVVAVAGNHDWDTLRNEAPRLQREYDFRFLGGDGWESHVVGGAVRIFGWSYPAKHHGRCPLADLQVEPSSLPTIGLVHVQRTGPDAHYAWAQDDDFRRHPEVDLWVIGHVHVPNNQFDGSLCVVNPGSPQAMDFGEEGWHGATVVAARGKGQVVEAERVPTSTAWYQRVGIELRPEMTDVNDVRAHVRERLAAFRDEILRESGLVRHLEFRVELIGHSPVPRAALQGIARELERGLDVGASDGGACQTLVGRAGAAGVRPVRDLAEYARWTGPIAVLARVLLALQSPEPPPPDVQAMLARLGQEVRQRAEHRSFAALGEDFPLPDEAHLRALAVEEGFALLEALLAQNPDAGRPAEVPA